MSQPRLKATHLEVERDLLKSTEYILRHEDEFRFDDDECHNQTVGAIKAGSVYIPVTCEEIEGRRVVQNEA